MPDQRHGHFSGEIRGMTSWHRVGGGHLYASWPSVVLLVVRDGLFSGPLSGWPELPGFQRDSGQFPRQCGELWLCGPA